MADSISLVVSGKTFSDIRKDDLRETSAYFSALLSGQYKDSSDESYKFNGWSTTAFSVLMKFVTTGDIDLRGKNAEIFRTALGMAEYLALDGFRPQLALALITSWTDLVAKDALELADELGVRSSLEEYSLLKVLTEVERQEECTKINLQINYDLLILVTKIKCFWDFTVDEEKRRFEDVPERWSKVFKRYQEVLQLAMKLPPNASKARALAGNLNLHLLDEKYRSNVWNLLRPESVTSKVLAKAFETHLFDVRQNAREVLSHIRIPFVIGFTKVKTFGVAEFNMNTWSWEVQEYKAQFDSSHRIVRRDCVTFLGHTGLFIIRIGKREPIFIENLLLGELLSKLSPNCYSICVIEMHLFIFVEIGFGEVTSKLYQFTVTSNEFRECVEVPLKNARLTGHGNELYIVGYSFEEPSSLCVYEYKMNSKELSLVVRSKAVSFVLKSLLVEKGKIYVLSDDAYTMVDIVKKENQTLEVKSFVGLVRDLFYFESILDVALHDRGLLLLLQLSTGSPSKQLMVAHLNVTTAEISCRCLLPQVLDRQLFPNSCFYNNFYPQMEKRRASDGVLRDTEDVLKRLKHIV